MQYSFVHGSTRGPACRACRFARRTTISRRDGATLAEQDVEFDISLQLQTDPFLMPIENNGVLWPTKLSPRVPAAVRRIPKQRFDSPEQLDFARCCPTTRGTLSGAPPPGQPEPGQKADVLRAVALRQTLNDVEHYEPTGDEVFPGSPSGGRGGRGGW